MATVKPRAKKKRLIKAAKEATTAPFFALLRKFGKKRSSRWRLNPHKRRTWKTRKIKA